VDLFHHLNLIFQKKQKKYSSYTWVGWPGSAFTKDQENEIIDLAADNNAVPVFLTEEEQDEFYYGFCNETLWPLFHYFPSETKYDEASWQRYKKINEKFAEKIASMVRPGDVIWIHDYHLLLLPQLLRERLPNTQIGFFLHIPFPSFEIFRLIPLEWARDILTGMLGADLIGFHTYDSANVFP